MRLPIILLTNKAQIAVWRMRVLATLNWYDVCSAIMITQVCGQGRCVARKMDTDSSLGEDYSYPHKLRPLSQILLEEIIWEYQENLCLNELPKPNLQRTQPYWIRTR